MKYKKTFLAVFSSSCIFATSSQAFDVVEAGQPVVTGEPSRVGAPGNHRTSLNIPGTNTDIAFGGFVKLDMHYDLDHDLGITTDPLLLAIPANETDGKTSFTAAASRLNFRTQTHTDYGTVATYVEGHFLPDSKFNLRHAYGEYGPFLAGKTWTNFMHFLGVPRTVKLGAPKGYAIGRPEQVRYTHQAGPNTFAVALENADQSSVSPVGGGVDTETPLPQLTLRYQYKRNFGIAGMVGRIASNETTSGVDEEVTNYGISAQAALPLGSSTTLKGNVMVGSGLGNYLDNAPPIASRNRSPDAFLDTDGSLETVDLQSFGLSLEQRWSADWSSTLGTSWVEQELPDDVAGFQGVLDTIQFSYVNLNWDVNQRLAVGVEYQYADAEKVSGEEVDASRIQAAVQYQF